ncbi:MAG: T9SS type A sorting domain-containing protein [Candidatus Kapabacteria bacterium]|nr:T9SS type A sorting domain-containing protein [Candidatus Kapabacteria bacterium]
MKCLIVILTCLLGFNNLFAQQVENIVPKPCQSFEKTPAGKLSITNAKIILSPQTPAFKQAYELNSILRTKGFDTLKISIFKNYSDLTNNIILSLPELGVDSIISLSGSYSINFTKDYPGAEGYILDVSNSFMIIAGCDATGLHNGLMTASQLISGTKADVSIVYCRIIDVPEYPERWYYWPTNFLPAANSANTRAEASIASKFKLNGVLLTDSKFSFSSFMPKYYSDSVSSFGLFSKQNYLKIAMACMSFGYSNDILFNDPNYATGLPVKNQRFIIKADTACLIPSSAATIKNGDFENHNGNNFPNFAYIDDPGSKSFADNQIFFSGATSVRFDLDPAKYTTNNNYRVVSRTICSPFKLYHVHANVRTESLQADEGPRVTIIGNHNPSLNYCNVNVPWDTKGAWQEVDITFNSLNSDTINVYIGIWGGRSGKIWWDNFTLTEVPFVNTLRRDGTPLTVDNPLRNGFSPIEGKDYSSFQDPLMGNIPWNGCYTSWHNPPTFKIIKGGQIANGDSLNISYYHAVIIYDGQVAASMSEPKLYDIVDKQLGLIDSLLQTNTFFMSHDELRTMNWDFGDQNLKMTPAQILAYNVNKCTEIIYKYKPNADIWVWSDMFDEFHNAVKKDYYLVNGDLTGSANLISNKIGIGNWNGQPTLVDSSLKFFSSKGFRQIAAVYYDADENQIRQWKQWTKNVPGFKGMIYTTWTNNYSKMEPFSEYAWNHAPYIYHEPKKVPLTDKYNFDVKVKGDNWDKGWSLVETKVFYRVDPSAYYVSEIIPALADLLKNYTIDFHAPIKYLEYYLQATDNRGNITTIPRNGRFVIEGDKFYSKTLLSLPEQELYADGNVTIYPSPLINQDELSINFILPDYEGRLEINDIFGNQIYKSAIYSNQMIVDCSGFSDGLYFITIINKSGRIIKKFIKLR